MTQSDSELLQQFGRDRSEEAFATLVRRHVDLVYSTALRQLNSSQLAEDVTQSVFVDLSRNADKLHPNTILTAWLYQVARRTAIDVIRSESRRQVREQIAVELSEMKSPDPQWKAIEPLLEDAMATLDEQDRSSILLRYFENKSLREVGEALGTSDDTAQKRVSRAVERLRGYFSKRGIAIGSAGLVALLSANAVQSAPIALGTTISSAAALGSAIKTGGAVAAGKTLLMTTTQKVLMVTAVAAVLGTTVYELSQNSRLQSELQQIQDTLRPLAAENEQLRRDRETLQAQLLSARQEIEQGRRQVTELAKLRNDVTRLRERQLESVGGAPGSAHADLKSWLSRIDVLKKWLEEKPGDKIPEMQLLTEQDWLDAAHDKLQSDRDIRKALSRLRKIAENKLSQQMVTALKRYMEANQGKLPTEVSELQAYFKSPIDAAALERYEIVQPKSTSANRGTDDDEWHITQKSPIDDEFDGRDTITPSSWGSRSPAWKKNTDETADWKTLAPVEKAYKAAYGIDSPSDYSLLRPYVTTPEQKAALERIIKVVEDNEKSEKN